MLDSLHMSDDGLLGIRLRQLYALKLIADQLHRLQSRGNRPGPTGFFVTVLLLAVHALRSIPAHELPLSLVSTRAALGLNSAALHPHSVVSGDWARLAKSAVVHLDVLHLTYNVCSFLGLAVRMERTFGTVGFAALVMYLAVAGSAMYVGTSIAVLRMMDDIGYYSNSVAGFSGVIFGIMTVINGHPSLAPGDQQIFGVVVPGRFLIWKHLFVCKLLIPESSLLGHFCGITAGMTFLYVRAVIPSGLRHRLHFE